jgi:hypothetical protein
MMCLIIKKKQKKDHRRETVFEFGLLDNGVKSVRGTGV